MPLFARELDQLGYTARTTNAQGTLIAMAIIVRIRLIIAFIINYFRSFMSETNFDAEKR